MVVTLSGSFASERCVGAHPIADGGERRLCAQIEHGESGVGKSGFSHRCDAVTREIDACEGGARIKCAVANRFHFCSQREGGECSVGKEGFFANSGTADAD